jgi:hypothetical protein
MAPFEFARGETISLALDAVEGDPASVSAVAARLKPVGAGGTVVAAGAAVAASFAVTSRAAAGDDPAGWTLTIGAAESQALKPGLYRADARIEIGSGVVITDAISLRIVEPVSGS